MKLTQRLAIGLIRTRINFTAMASRKKAAAMAFELFCTPVRRSRHKSPRIFESAEKLSFLLEGKLVRGYRWNHPQINKFLIVHGFESSSRNFDRYIVPMIKKGYEVIAFDAPAHGASSGKTVNLPLYTSMLKEITNRFGPVSAFLAHSFGGIALAHLLESIHHDEHTKVVLIAPATETTSAIDSFFTFLKLDPALRAPFDALILEKGGVPASHYSIRRTMHHINATVLWIHDEDDDVTLLKDALQVRNDNHPNVEFMITKGLGHRRIYRENKVVKRVLEFF